MDKFDKIDRSRRMDADKFFRQQMSNADGYGRMADDARRAGKEHTARMYEDKVRDAQKQMKKAVNFKLNDNKSKGRQYGDGYDF